MTTVTSSRPAGLATSIYEHVKKATDTECVLPASIQRISSDGQQTPSSSKLIVTPPTVQIKEEIDVEDDGVTADVQQVTNGNIWSKLSTSAVKANIGSKNIIVKLSSLNATKTDIKTEPMDNTETRDYAASPQVFVGTGGRLVSGITVTPAIKRPISIPQQNQSNSVNKLIVDTKYPNVMSEPVAVHNYRRALNKTNDTSPSNECSELSGSRQSAQKYAGELCFGVTRRSPTALNDSTERRFTTDTTLPSRNRKIPLILSRSIAQNNLVGFTSPSSSSNFSSQISTAVSRPVFSVRKVGGHLSTILLSSASSTAGFQTSPALSTASSSTPRPLLLKPSSTFLCGNSDQAVTVTSNAEELDVSVSADDVAAAKILLQAANSKAFESSQPLEQPMDVMTDGVFDSLNSGDLSSFVVADTRCSPDSTAPSSSTCSSLSLSGLKQSQQRRPIISIVPTLPATSSSAVGAVVTEVSYLGEKESMDYRLMRARNNLAVRRCRARSRFLRIKLCEELSSLRHRNSALQRQLLEERRRTNKFRRQRDYLGRLLIDDKRGHALSEDLIRLLDDDIDDDEFPKVDANKSLSAECIAILANKQQQSKST